MGGFREGDLVRWIRPSQARRRTGTVYIYEAENCREVTMPNGAVATVTRVYEEDGQHYIDVSFWCDPSPANEFEPEQFELVSRA